MTEVMAIGAAIAAVKDFVDLVGKLGDGVSKEQPEVISQLYDSVLDIQQQLLMAQSSESDLLSRCRALEEEIARARDWQTETTRYILRRVDGGVVRQLRSSHASEDPPHWLCANCFEEQRKSYLQKDPKTLGGRHIWKCPRCSTAVMVDQGAAPGTG